MADRSAGADQIRARLDPAEVAWSAGFLDGEGSFQINMRGTSYAAQ